MAKSQTTYSKKEREKKRRKKKQDKLERKQQRKLEKEQSGKKDFQDQLSYLDENGNLTSTPPDPSKKRKQIKAEDIVLGVPPKEKEELPKRGLGIVDFFDQQKSFGFIIDSGTQERIFVHMNDVETSMEEGQEVQYDVEETFKGLKAINVKSPTE